MDKLGSIWFKSVQIGSNQLLIKLVQIGSHWFKLVHIGSNWFKLVQIGSKQIKMNHIDYLVQISSSWFKLVQYQSELYENYWTKLDQTGSNWNKSVRIEPNWI